MHQLSYKRPTWAEISLSSLVDNYHAIQRRLPSGSQVMAIVKADAYGHGGIECAQALDSNGAPWFGVALIEEAIVLREAGITKPILCLGGFWGGQAEYLVNYNLTTSINRIAAAELLNAEASKAGKRVDYHLKIDTGLGRLGVSYNEIHEFALELKRFDHINLTGVMTHFADADGEDRDYTLLQNSRFNEAVTILRNLGFNPKWRHCNNSAGVYAFPEFEGNLVRTGGAMYGLKDAMATESDNSDLKPVMSLRSRIIMMKEWPAGVSIGYGCTFTTNRTSRIASIPIGYADGMRRAFSNNSYVLVQGRPAPIVGRVSMDLTTIDVTDIPEARIGDEVVIIGEQNGAYISAEEVAKRIDSISYEITCGITYRVPRIFLTS